jgi:hypothetical protein
MRLPVIAGIGVFALVISCTGGDESLPDTSWTLVALGPASSPNPRRRAVRQLSRSLRTGTRSPETLGRVCKL